MLSVISGFFLPFQGLRLALSPGLRRFVLVPLMANIAVFAALGYFGISYFETFMENSLPAHEWLEFLRWVLWLVFALAFALTLFFGFTIVANLIAAPFNGVLAARVEERLTGEPPPADETSPLRQVGPALIAELGKLLYFASRAIPLGVLFLIPGINMVAGIAWVLFGFWFLAIEYGDYPMSNHHIETRQQRQRLRRRRLKTLAFGAGVTAMMMIPVLQFAAMPAAVAGATRLWTDDLRDA